MKPEIIKDTTPVPNAVVILEGKRHELIASLAAAVVITVVITLAVIGIYYTVKNDYGYDSPAAVVGLLITVALGWVSIFSFKWIDRYFGKYKEIDDSLCADMVAFCKHSVLNNYRKYVVSMKRQFTVYEYECFKLTAQHLEREAAKTALYNQKLEDLTDAEMAKYFSRLYGAAN